MIETLIGTQETVHHKADSHIRLYVNDECEHYPPHWHSDMEILCPLEGNYTAIIADTTYVLRPGDLLIIAPGTLHDLLAAPEGIRIIFQISWAPLQEIYGLQTVLSKLSPCCLITPENQPGLQKELHRHLLEIRDLYLEGSFLLEPSIYANALSIVTLAAQQQSGRTAPDQPAVSRRSFRHQECMQQSCDYILMHCCENLTLRDVSSRAGFSKFYFERLFLEYTGASFYQYLIRERISHAQHLMENPEVTITEAAFRSGFSSTAAFSKSFRRVVGCAPSQYRRLRSEESS